MEVTDQQTIKQIFPDWREYPRNSMTPVLHDYNGQKIIAFLVLADESILKDFINEKADGRVNVRTKLYKEANWQKIGFDLVIHFEFLFNEKNNPYFESVLYGTDQEAQVAFCKALKEVEEVHVFIANNQATLFKVKHISWGGQNHPLLNEVLSCL